MPPLKPPLHAPDRLVLSHFIPFLSHSIEPRPQLRFTHVSPTEVQHRTLNISRALGKELRVPPDPSRFPTQLLKSRLVAN